MNELQISEYIFKWITVTSKNMTPEKQVCSLKWAKKLEKLKVPQLSIFTWRDEGDKYSLTSEHCDFDATITTEKGERKVKDYSAFTVAELGKIIMNGLRERDDDGNVLTVIYENTRCNDPYCDCGRNPNYHAILKKNGEIFRAIIQWKDNHNEANCRAEMLVYLLENNFVRL